MSDPTAGILEFSGDTVVHASAGSGKTSLLVNKFLHTLKEADEKGLYPPLDNVLAITFTDKAAAEMRNRISQELLRGVKELEKKGGDSENARLVRHLRSARRKMTQAYISTIHSFCARVLKENPIEAGLDPGFEIMDAAASAEMMERALERFLLMKLRKGDAALVELAYRYGFSSDYAFESSIKKIIASILPLMRAASADPRELLKEYELLEKEIDGRLGRFKTQAEGAIGELEQEVNTDKRRERLEAVKEKLARLDPKSDAGSAAGFRLANELSRQSRGFRFKRAEPAGMTAEILADALDDYSKTVVSSLAHESCTQLRDLLEEFYGYFENRVKSRALLDFDDLQERTLYLFERRTEVLEHYRKKFKRVLVDEFQDINGLQKKLIYFLASPGEGRLFIVGDPKQAIYGFRGGNNLSLQGGGDRADFLSLRLSMSVPLFIDSKQAKGVDQRTAERMQQGYALQDEWSKVRAQISAALADYEQAREQFALFKSGIIPQAQQTVASMLAGYLVNKVDFLNLVRSQVTLFNYEVQYWRALAKTNQSLARLIAAVGDENIHE